MIYNQDYKNIKVVLKDNYSMILKKLNEELPLNELMQDKITLHRMSLDYIFASVIDEGNTYTLSSLQTLVERNIPSKENTYEEATMIMNIKHSLDYVLEDFSVNLDKRLILDFHSILARGLIHPKDVGQIRNRPVYITGSTYEPPSGQPFVNSELEAIIETSEIIEEPFSKAIYLNLNICYLQPFVDLNKRTARTIQTYSMYNSGVVPLYVNSNTIDGFRESLKSYYEFGDYNPYVRWFVDSYIKMYRKLIGSKKVEDILTDSDCGNSGGLKR